MTEPLDILFGEGCTEALLQASIVDNHIPSITQTLEAEDEVLVTLIWPGVVSQNVRFNSTTKEAAWGVGLCDAPQKGFLEKFAAQVFTPMGVNRGIKLVSVCAPHIPEFEDPFLAMGLYRDPDDSKRLIAEIRPGTEFSQWAEGFNND